MPEGTHPDGRDAPLSDSAARAVRHMADEANEIAVGALVAQRALLDRVALALLGAGDLVERRHRGDRWQRQDATAGAGDAKPGRVGAAKRAANKRTLPADRRPGRSAGTGGSAWHQPWHPERASG